MVLFKHQILIRFQLQQLLLASQWRQLSTNDFIIHNGVGLFTTPADSVVTAAKLATTGTASSSTLFKGRYGLVHGYRWRINDN